MYIRTYPLCCTAVVGLLCFLTFWFPVLRWFFSGVVSSIGLGTGANTGVLFLMPYTATVAKAHNSFWAPYLQTLPATILHATGSACGELPPFFLADTLITKFVKKSQMEWILRYMRRYGWWMIFTFACWPSMFMDMCGLCAGVVKVNTTTFLSATIAGKIVKSCALSAMLVMATQEGKAFLPHESNIVFTVAPWIGCVCTLYAVRMTWKEYSLFRVSKKKNLSL